MAKLWPAWDEVRRRPGGSGYLETLADVEDAFDGLAIRQQELAVAAGARRLGATPTA